MEAGSAGVTGVATPSFVAGTLDFSRCVIANSVAIAAIGHTGFIGDTNAAFPVIVWFANVAVVAGVFGLAGAIDYATGIIASSVTTTSV